MKVFETNCVIVKGMTDIEKSSYVEKFGESYWNDNEDIVCIPLHEMNIHQIAKLEMFFSTIISNRAQFLVIEFDNQ
jgi:hypothetical protein